MAKIDYQALTMDELKKIEKDVTDAISDYDSRKRKEAIEHIDKVAQELGFSTASELFDTKKAKKKLLTPKPYYRDPNNPKNTASKMGRKPKWLKLALMSGYTEEELRIKDNPSDAATST